MVVQTGHFASDQCVNQYTDMHACIPSTVVTDALLLKHQAISIHSANQRFMVLNQELLYWTGSTRKSTCTINNIRKWNYIFRKMTQLSKG